MRVVRICYKDLQENEDILLIDGKHKHHLINVLRCRLGQVLSIFNGKGFECSGKISTINKNHLTVTIFDRILVPDNRLPLNLFIALIKPERMNWAIAKATELGVKSINFMITEFTDKRYTDNQAKKYMRHWNLIAAGACEQSHNNWLPKINLPFKFREVINLKYTRLIAHPGCEWTPINVKSEPVALCVGPEGGFSAKEIKMAKNSSSMLTGLGPNILRAETAAIVGLSLLAREMGRFSYCSDMQ